MERGLPRIVSIDPFDEGIRAEKHYAIVARLSFQARQDGLPVQGELQRVHHLEDEIEKSLRSIEATWLGHVTYNGTLLVLYYAPKPAPSSISVKAGFLKKEQISLESRHDPSWTVYEVEMEPTEIELELMHFAQLYSALAKHGDDHSLEREVDFSAKFSSEEERSHFLTDVLNQGFTIRPEEATWEPTPDSFWCQFVLNTQIIPEILMPQTLLVRKMAAKHGGEFDGWACHVMT